MNNAAQHTISWFRSRLGIFTGSNVGMLMKSGRSKTETFGETAKSYIYQVAAEREMNPAIVNDDELFEIYLNEVNVTSKAMRFGTEQELNARELYEKLTGRHVVEIGFCKHPTIKNFGTSPDGFHYDENKGEKIAIEIKCPSLGVFMKYKNDVIDNSSLLHVKYEYFYQCMAHIYCLGADACDFIVYNPFLKKPINIVRILPDYDVCKEMENRINSANEMIEQIINK